MPKSILPSVAAVTSPLPLLKIRTGWHRTPYCKGDAQLAGRLWHSGSDHSRPYTRLLFNGEGDSILRASCQKVSFRLSREYDITEFWEALKPDIGCRSYRAMPGDDSLAAAQEDPRFREIQHYLTLGSVAPLPW